MTDFELSTFTNSVPVSFSDIKYLHDNLKPDLRNIAMLSFFLNEASERGISVIDLIEYLNSKKSIISAYPQHAVTITA